jgi:hypothetical protein
MSDRHARIAVFFATAYFVSAVSILAGTIVGQLGWNEPLRAACLVGSIATSLCTLGLWRTYVNWSGLRTMSTFALLILILLQVLIWKPIFPAGCANEDPMRLGQSSSLLGIWLGACSMAWWAKINCFRVAPCILDDQISRSRQMNSDSVRLCVTFAILPFLIGVLFFSWATIDTFNLVGEFRTGVFMSIEVCALLAISIWLALWGRRVHWTPAGIRSVCMLGLILMLAPAGVLLPEYPVVFGGNRFQPLYDVVRFYCLNLLAFGAWFAGTSWAWRSDTILIKRHAVSTQQLSALLRCPVCSYSLTGLREVRCPECGWTSTIDETVRRSVIELIELQSA